MVNVKVTTKCGNSWKTPFNGTMEDAKAYFMGMEFEHANERDTMTVCEVVEIGGEPV